MLETDVAIIGSGPVGLFAIFECGMLKMHCHVFDALDKTGGQCRALYPEKPIYDIPAYPKITGEELADNLYEQAKSFNPNYHLSQKVIGIKQLCDLGKKWQITTDKGVEVIAKSIIIAAGVGAFGPNKPPLANIEDFEENCIHYYVKSRQIYKGKKILIAGGGDSAVDWVLSLSEIAEKITVVHRRAKFRASPESEARMYELAKSGKVEILTPFQLHSLHGKNGKLESVTIESMEGDQKTIDTDFLLPFFGLSMNLGAIAEWGLGIEKNHISVDQSTSKTNRDGIYAIGDISSYPNKLKLILTGFAEAAQAAHSIRKFLYPDEIVHFEYSTTKGVP
jgi:thioredoxin reductase (NADPH)